MKSTITNKLANLNGRKAIGPFLTCGFPDMPSFERLAHAACEAGADILEIGFPFSDPLADGPAIQYSSQTALRNGFSISTGFESIERVSRNSRVPIAIMTYQNIVRAAGKERFLENCARAGVSGLIIPDLPLELAGDFRVLCRQYDVDLILLVAPTTTSRRRKQIAAQSRGFVYLVSVRGTTGSRTRFPHGTVEYIKSVKAVSPLPVMVGFGVSGPALAAQAASHADGVIIGSALVEIIRKNSDGTSAAEKVKKFLLSIEEEINS